MAAVDVGSLRITIGADIKPLEEGKKRAEKVTRDMGKRFDSLNRRLSRSFFRLAPWATLTGAILTWVDVIKTLTDDARALEDLSLLTGTSVPRLAELKYMMQGVGGTLSDLFAVLQVFNNSLRTSVEDRSSATALALNALGISARNADGSFKTLDEALPQIAEKFAGWTDGANKAAIAQALFGEQAERMTDILNQGSEGLDKSRQGAQWWKRSSEDTAKKAKQWNDGMAQLTANLNVLDILILSPFFPLGTAVVSALSNAALLTRDIAKAIREAFSASTTTRVMEIQRQLHKLDSTFADQKKELVQLTESEREFSGTRHQLILTEIARNRDAAYLLREELRLLTQKQRDSAPEQGLGAGWSATLSAPTIDPNARKREIAAALSNIDILQSRLNGLPTQYAHFTEQFIEGNRTSYGAVVEAIDNVLSKYALEEDQRRRLERLKLELRKQEQDTILDTASMLGTTLSAVFKGSKGSLIAETLINTSASIMRAYRNVPWPYNMAQAAMLAAQGAAQVSTLKSATENSASSAAASPSTPVPAAKDGFDLFISGVDRAHWYSADVVQGLFNQINEALRNGATSISVSNAPL